MYPPPMLQYTCWVKISLSRRWRPVAVIVPHHLAVGIYKDSLPLYQHLLLILALARDHLFVNMVQNFNIKISDSWPQKFLFSVNCDRTSTFNQIPTNGYLNVSSPALLNNNNNITTDANACSALCIVTKFCVSFDFNLSNRTCHMYATKYSESPLAFIANSAYVHYDLAWTLLMTEIKENPLKNNYI